jgi:hypothetical protein
MLYDIDVDAMAQMGIPRMMVMKTKCAEVSGCDFSVTCFDPTTRYVL